ncbi:MAG: beta-lactamase family protein [Chloroflexi bacterium]|nr:beta-lactamase family protein [Chloroflexota bacterium]
MNRKFLLLSFVTIFALACGDSTGADENATEESQPVGEETGMGTDGGGMSLEVDALMARYADGPGGAVMVIQDGEIVHQNGYGLADVKTGKSITTDSVFHLGSVGKQFTAMGVMMLVERGLVEYDAPIGTCIPELAWMDNEVTVRRLLHHTSGILGYDESEDIYNALVESSATPTNEDLLDVLAQQGGMLANPGDEYSYSNTGYEILGSLIERVSGQSYSAFMDENIFKPLGMLNTFSVPNDRRLKDENVAQSYYFEDGQPWAYEPDILDALNGSGSIYSTLGDMYLYDQALYTNKLVSQETLAEAYVSGVLNNGEETAYGFALDLGEYAGETYVGHSGSWLGFDSYYLRFPERKLSVVVLLNLDYSEEGAEGIAFSAADLYLK